MQQAQQAEAAPPRPATFSLTGRNLWIRTDSRVSCIEHLDEHSRTQAQKSPRIVQLFTSDEGQQWFKLTRQDLGEFMLLTGAPIDCEECA